MRFFSFFLLLCSLGFSQTEYILDPDCYFTETVYTNEYGRETSRSIDAYFSQFVIAEGKKTNYIIEKSEDWTRGYHLIKDGEVIAKHSACFWSWGAFMDSMKEFEIYDDQDISIGRIEGNYETNKAAEFSFFDALG